MIALICIVQIGLSAYSRSQLNQGSTDDTTELRVMTYNLLFKNPDPTRSIALITANDPDILLVQELTPQWSILLDQTLRQSHPYRVSEPHIDYHGIAIYSKYLIENPVLLGGQSTSPFALSADLTIEDHSIQLINVHLASPGIALEHKRQFIPLYAQNYQVRKQQVQALLDLADNQKYHAQILAGDLNTLQCEPLYSRLSMKWIDTGNKLLRWRRFTFPNSSTWMSLMTLDYIMARGTIRLERSQVIRGGTSDHYPVITTVEIPH